MVRGMKKPYDLSTRKTAAAITKINNFLPVFPLGLPASKLTDQEVVGFLEWSLLLSWRKKFDLDGYVPTLRTKAKLILECEAIKRNEGVKEKGRKDEDHNNINYKKTSLEIPRQEHKKMNAVVTASSIARTAALTAHMLPLSFFLKNKTWQTQRSEKKNLTTDKEASRKNRPLSQIACDATPGLVIPAKRRALSSRREVRTAAPNCLVGTPTVLKSCILLHQPLAPICTLVDVSTTILVFCMGQSRGLSQVMG
jgi:hypothetical protein